MVITKLLKLYIPTKSKQELLLETMARQTNCVNWWVDLIRTKGKANLRELQQEGYYPARDKFGLSAWMTQAAKHEAIGLCHKGRKHPTATPYAKTSALLVSRMKLDGNNLGISLGDGYIWLPFKAQPLPVGTMKASRIIFSQGNWYCHLAIDVPTPPSKLYKRVLGVDTGIAKIATVADKNGKRTHFHRGEPLRNKRRHYYELRKKIQPKRHQGNVYKLLKRISKKESNWMRDTNHKISRQIVDYAKENKMSIAVENLAGIRERIVAPKRVRRMLHDWSFRQLITFIEYKAHLSGLEMFSVDPRNTSKTCPKCKNISRSNRKSQERFRCTKCKYESNADRVGAMNIAQRATDLLASR